MIDSLYGFTYRKLNKTLVGFVFPFCHSFNQSISVFYYHFWSELAPKAATELSLVVTFEAQDGKIFREVIARISIQVVYLDGLAPHLTHAAGSVAGKQHVCSDLSGN